MPALLAALRQRWAARFPGLAVAALVSVTATFLSEHYGAPAMLMAILLGIALNVMAEEGRTVAGIDWAARDLLRLGVALLGVRISAELLADLGATAVALVVLGVGLTIGFGLFASRFVGRGLRFGFLTAGSVAICGASAAMAIAAILPRDPRREQDLVFTVVGVTVLSTAAMIVYPILTAALGFDGRATGIFLGATIHDVAQVVGAGFSVSPEAGETATLVKLIRVTLLAPVVLAAALILRARAADADAGAPHGAGRPPLVPGFVAGFLVLAALNSFGLIPLPVAVAAAETSRWALVTAIAAVGMKTSVARLLQVGAPAMVLLLAETGFLALFVLVATRLVG